MGHAVLQPQIGADADRTPAHEVGKRVPLENTSVMLEYVKIDPSSTTAPGAPGQIAHRVRQSLQSGNVAVGSTSKHATTTQINRTASAGGQAFGVLLNTFDPAANKIYGWAAVEGEWEEVYDKYGITIKTDGNVVENGYLRSTANKVAGTASGPVVTTSAGVGVVTVGALNAFGRSRKADSGSQLTAATLFGASH
jgi:hypothetical protein